MKSGYAILAIALLLMACAPTQVQSQDDDSSAANMASSWSFTPKEGQAQAFEEALKAHAAHRKEQGDPRHWDAWQPVTGDKMTSYTVRSCCFKWADQDAYEQWSRESGVGQHYQDTVAPHVAHFSHGFSQVDFENSSWSEDTRANFVGVTTWKMNPALGYEAYEARSKLSKWGKEHEWDGEWAWFWTVGGPDRLGLAIPFENYADMQEPEQSFREFLIEKTGDADAVNGAWATFGDGMLESDYHIYRHRRDLTPHEGDQD